MSEGQSLGRGLTGRAHTGRGSADRLTQPRAGADTTDGRFPAHPHPSSPVTRPRESGVLPDRIRHRFPIFERLVYINSCSQGALSDAVRNAYARYLDDWDEKGAPWDYWVERGEAARAAFARLVNADPEEVAVTT